MKLIKSHPLAPSGVVSPPRGLTAPIFLFGTVSALSGGVLGAVMNGAGVPLSYLDGSPFSSYVIPGIILGIVIGGSQLVAAVTILRRSQRAMIWAAIAGVGLTVWIFCELAILGEYSWLQALYFGLGIAEIILVIAVREAPAVFHRRLDAIRPDK